MCFEDTILGKVNKKRSILESGIWFIKKGKGIPVKVDFSEMMISIHCLLA